MTENTIGIVVGILGILGSAFFYWRGKKKKRIVYNLESTILISEDLSSYENLKILYNNENIKSLTSTIIKIRNAGNDIIEPADFIPSTPIIISTSNAFLLQDVSNYKIECSNRKNRVSLNRKDESHLSVTFDFLGPKDEITITILHTGRLSITGELKQGDVKNYSSKKYEKDELKSKPYAFDSQDDHYYRYRDDFSGLWLRLMVMAILMIIVVLMIFMLTNFIAGESSKAPDIYSLLMIMMMMVCLMGMMIFNRRN